VPWAPPRFGLDGERMYQINPDDVHLAEEFRANPIGKHSPDLQRVLNLFRGEAMADKYVLICTKPHERWVLGQLTGVRGKPVKLSNHVFDRIEDAEWHVFKLRWKKYTGRDLPDQRS
jgi:hypothetical protein